jgi:ribosomal protein S18 acetylase RimI-like enzyme
MRKVTYNEKSLVSGILTDSFDTNQSVNYIVQQDHKRRERIRALMDYSFEVCYKFGEVYLSDDNHACALVLYPDKKKTTLKSVLLDIGLVFKCIGLSNIGKAFTREYKIKKIQPGEPIYYLWFIGVDPSYQGSGTGTKLMRELIEDSRKKELPICLETSTLRNLPWYDQFGFKVYHELDLSYILYFLKWDYTKK